MLGACSVIGEDSHVPPCGARSYSDGEARSLAGECIYFPPAHEVRSVLELEVRSGQNILDLQGSPRNWGKVCPMPILFDSARPLQEKTLMPQSHLLP